MTRASRFLGTSSAAAPRRRRTASWPRAMGYEAVHLLAAGKTNRVVCARGDSIVDVDINDGLAMHKTLNSEEYEVMEAMTGI